MDNWNVYLVMDLEGYGDRSAYEIAEAAIDGGIEVLQIRDKTLSSEVFVARAQPIRQMCKERGVDFIVNDYLELAVRLDADGLHVGQDDLSGKEARKQIGSDMWIGISASSIEEAKIALANDADYIGVGSIYPTSTKSDAGEAVTPRLIQQIKEITKLPIVGIGGIKQDNIEAVIAAGADSVAVVSAITQAPNPSMVTKQLKEKVLKVKGI